MRMRWVLTFKDSGAAKARLVIIGFTDPDLLDLHTQAPTMTRRTRQLLLSLAATKGWTVLKADAKTAFLQGQASQLDREVFARPVPELAEALHLKHDQAVRLRKACYGLVNAPREWYLDVDRTLKSIGLERLVTEPCAWRLRSAATGKSVGVITSHVDDFLITGDEQSPDWLKVVRAFYDAYKWTPWEVNTFGHCGVDVTQGLNRGFVLSQADYVNNIDQIELTPERRVETSASITEAERSEMRAVLGAVQWKVYQTGPQHSAQLSLLQSSITLATVQTLLDVNKLVREVHSYKHLTLKIHPLCLPDEDELLFVCWTDAALANRPDLSSTGGFVVGLTAKKLLDGQSQQVNLISWKSGKLPRKAKSSLGAEVQAMSEGEQELMFCRLQFAEMTGETVDLRDYWKAVNSIPGVIVIDAKACYDAVHKGLSAHASGLGLKDKHGALELMTLMECLEAGRTLVRWVHSEAQLADALTKAAAKEMMLRVLEQGEWTIVHDPQMVSAKNRRKLQKPTFESEYRLPEHQDASVLFTAEFVQKWTTRFTEQMKLW
ncbi:unnamed protein product [Polarella glacialis]|uniref:Reverse transcriptase Ty1/copia-type domain-containing protein n=1 Tax=Polarella glacialis TaxID=89957 RepID=A0A813GMP8_POLGL|nr:unnamed protein product [Polarella glacialis]